MKHYNLLIALMLCATINTGEAPDSQEASASYWQQYAPQFMQTALTSAQDYAASWVPKSIKDRVNEWSIGTKLTIITAILASLLAIYNRETIIQFVQDSLPQKYDIPQTSIFDSTSLNPNSIPSGFYLPVNKISDKDFDDIVATAYEKAPTMNPEAIYQLKQNFANKPGTGGYLYYKAIMQALGWK